MSVTDVLLRTEGIGKEFSSVRVLSDISVEIRSGEILGIIGENGAGKSTLMKILAGIYTPTFGRLFLDGKEIALRSAEDAKRAGIRIIPQEFNLVADLQVYENVFLGNELVSRSGLLDKKEMIRRTAELLTSLEVQVDPQANIQALSVAQRQMVEIAKALAFDARLLIMDEPTTVLTRREIDLLFGRMRALKAKGVTLVYISHKLREVKEIADRVLVLRDGAFICLEPTSALAIDEMARRMVGREFSQVFPPRRTEHGAVALEVQGLTALGAIENISFQLHKGEILGLAGLGGSGRTEVAETIIGVRRATHGRILVDGKPVTIRRPRDAVRAGLGYLSEDRQGSGIIVQLELVENVTLVSLGKYLLGLGLIAGGRERAAAQSYVKKFSIRAPRLDTRMEFLSGGNQQKVSLAKSLDAEPAILIVDEPTRGVDVSAKGDIYRFLDELAGRGIAIILISSELEEVIGMCSRVLVMKDGHLAGEVSGARVTEEGIMFLATGINGEA
jgi:ribose transport system ATP-binding protein